MTSTRRCGRGSHRAAWIVALSIPKSSLGVAHTRNNDALLCLGGRLADALYTAEGISTHLVAPLQSTGSAIEVFLAVPRGQTANPGLVELQHFLPGLVVEPFDLWSAVKSMQYVPSWMWNSWPADDSPAKHRPSGDSIANLSPTQEVLDKAGGGELLLYLQQDRCLQYFRSRVGDAALDRLIFSRLDLKWRCPHPALAMFDPAFVWIPEANLDDSQGLSAGHAIFPAHHAETYLGAWEWLSKGKVAKNVMNMEQWSANGFLKQRLTAGAANVRRYRQCAHRICGPSGKLDGVEAFGPWCNPATGARRDRPWEWALAVTLEKCYGALVNDRGGSDWTLEALQECCNEPIPFPEDIGFEYGGVVEFQDVGTCFRVWHDDFERFSVHSGAILDDPTLKAKEVLYMQRDQCRRLGNRYIYVHAGGSIGVCIPSVCPIEISVTLVMKSPLAEHLENSGALGVSPEKGIAEDPSIGVSRGADASGTPRWTVPWHAAHGLDFVLAGFQHAGASILYANLAKHPDIAFSEASRESREALFSLGHALSVSALDRQHLRGEFARKGVFGAYDGNLIQRPHAMARLRSLHRSHAVKLIVVVRHPLELFEQALNNEPPETAQKLLEAPETFLLSEALGAHVFPFWSKKEVLIVPYDLLILKSRTTLNRVCAFLGVEQFSPHAEPVFENDMRAFQPQRFSLQGAPAHEKVKPLLESYFADDVEYMHSLLQQYGDWHRVGAVYPGTTCTVEGIKIAGCGCFVKQLRGQCCSGDEVSQRIRSHVGEGSSLTSFNVGAQPCAGFESCCGRFQQSHKTLVRTLIHAWILGILRPNDDYVGRTPLISVSESLEAEMVHPVGKAEHGRLDAEQEDRILFDPTGDLDDAFECLRTDPAQKATCLRRVRFKDPWGCFQGLRPDAARSNAWINCCGGVTFALVLLGPCPTLQCCTSRILPHHFNIESASDGSGAAIMPAWATCHKNSDQRWLQLRKLLIDHRGETVRPPAEHLKLARELVDLMAEERQMEQLHQLHNMRKQWVFNDEFCYVGFAHALYVLAVGSEGQRERAWFRFQLSWMLNIDGASDDMKSRAVWLLDISGWPISAMQMVALALEQTAPASLAHLNAQPVGSDWVYRHTEAAGAPIPSGIILLSSHMFALDAALAFASLLSGEQGRGTIVPMRWYGFPEKWKHHDHIKRICTATPGMTCEGPFAQAVERITNRIVSGWEQSDSSHRAPKWPYNVVVGEEGRKPFRGSISWASLISEVASIVHGLSVDRDMLLCGYPTLLCIALDEVLESSEARQVGARTPNFLFTLLSGSPVEYAEPRLQPMVRDRVRSLGDGRLNRGLVCISHFDQAYIHAAIGMSVPRLPFGARYIAQALTQNIRREADPIGAQGTAALPYMPAVISNDHSRQILMSRWKLPFHLDVMVLLNVIEVLGLTSRLRFKLIAYEMAYDYDVLSDFRAAVFFPWNWELVTFLEWYGLGLPVFVPGPSWAIPYVSHMLAANPDLRAKNMSAFWTNLREDWAHGVPSSARLQEHRKMEGIAEWWLRTDYVQLPHVRSFSHLGDLVAQISGCDFRSWAKVLHESNVGTHRVAAAKYLDSFRRAGAQMTQSTRFSDGGAKQ